MKHIFCSNHSKDKKYFGGYLNRVAIVFAVIIVAFHGTADRVGIPMKDVETSVAWWAEHNGCNKNPTANKISEDVTQSNYRECKGNAEVVFYHINKGGHVWPDPPTAE